MEADSSSIAAGWSPVGLYVSAVLNGATRTRYLPVVRATIAVLALAAALAAPSAAVACACCSEPGTWYQVRTPFGAAERGELGHLRFTTANWVQTNEGGPGFDSAKVTAALTGRFWRWQLKGGP